MILTRRYLGPFMQLESGGGWVRVRCRLDGKSFHDHDGPVVNRRWVGRTLLGGTQIAALHQKIEMILKDDFFKGDYWSK